MEDKKIVSPEEKDEGQLNPKDTETKSAEQLMKEIKEANEREALLKKQLQDKEAFIGKQSTEIGTLRKFREENSDLIEQAKTATGDKKDALVDELSKELVSQGYSEDDAKINAEILAKSTNKVLDARRSKEMKIDIYDLLDEAFEEDKIDKNIFNEHEVEIWNEVEKRRPALTARKNFKIIKECYESIIKKKAEKMKEERKPQDEANRDALIDENKQPQGGNKQQEADADKKLSDSIMNAGRKASESVFF